MKDRAFVEEIITSFTQMRGLTIEPLKLEDYASATDLMNKHKIDYEDALHLASALRAGAQEIVSNDKDFDATTLKRIF